MDYTYDNLCGMKIAELRNLADKKGVDLSGAMLKAEIVQKIYSFMKEREYADQETSRPEDAEEVTGILDIMQDGYGFLRFHNYQASQNDVYVPEKQISRFGLKRGDEITGDAMRFNNSKSPSLVYVKKINDLPIEQAITRVNFDRLLPIYPKERIRLGYKGEDNISNKLIDLICPVGKGQRGLIVAPPKAGKTTLIKSIATAITKHHPDIHLIILLVDERPEEVTDIQRSVKGADVAYSTFDQGAANHCRVSEMVLERAKRLVEAKKDVIILLDSLTRLTRAYNLNNEYSGKVMSGGIDPSAFHFPKKFFGSARNIENGGSLTVLATALVETGSRMDTVIFEEFKGTGNMELKLDRALQERRIFPAMDIVRSGTRREDLLLSKEEIQGSTILRNMIRTRSDDLDLEALRKYIDYYSNPEWTAKTIAADLIKSDVPARSIGFTAT